MSSIVQTAENQIKEVIKTAFNEAVENDKLTALKLGDINLEVPADIKNGDYSTNAAFMLASSQKKAPRVIADILSEYISLENTYFSNVEVAAAGFINFFLNSAYYADILLDVSNMGEKYGSSNYGGGKKALVEFVSANPTGPMHVGNARGGALGDCLATVLEMAGFVTEREFYINDAGNQIEKFALSLDIRYRQICGEDIVLPEDAYHGQDITAHAKAFYEIHADFYMTKDEDERKNALVHFALPLNVAEMEENLKKYRIKYDTWFRESALHENGEVAKVIELLKESGYTYENDGALWFKATEFNCDKDFVLVRSNSIPTYIVPDIAYHYNKLSIRGFHKAIDILGADHHGYVPRLKAALLALGIDSTRLDVVLMQMVRLVQGGETIKASKRSGNAITLLTLLDEVPIDAARFFFIYREANTHLDFDLDLAVEKSSENPVYYCQYAHARICSIFSKLKDEGISYNMPNKKELSLLTSDEEKALITHIASLTQEIIGAAKNYDPSRITRYAVVLATRFHKFYNAHRVIGEDSDTTNARLFLCDCVRTVMKTVLTMLKIEAPKQM